MVRWEPDASGRLRRAALELYVERGFEQATVADIADRAGLTARTFFRYFPDKREVLFAGSEQLPAELAAAVEHAPPSAPPLAAVAAGLQAFGVRVGGDRAWSQQRQLVINANAELRERELIKLACIADAFAQALRRRGVPDVEAGLAGETGVAVLRVAFDRWLTGPDDVELTVTMSETLTRLRELTATTD